MGTSELLPDHSQHTATELLRSSPEHQFSAAELHGRLITFDPDLKYDPEVERPHLTIVDDTTLAVGEVTIKLSETKRFIINALRLYQGFPQSGPDIRSFGYHSSKNAFSVGMHQLLTTLEAVSSAPLIVTENTPDDKRMVQYLLLPEVQIVDLRSSVKDWDEVCREKMRSTLVESSPPLGVLEPEIDPTEVREVLIIGDDRLYHDGRAITVRPDLLVLRGLLAAEKTGWLTADDIQSAAHDPRRYGGFNYAYRSLTKTIEQLTGILPALQTKGEGPQRTYRLNPRLIFTDATATADADPLLRPYALGLQEDIPEFTHYDGHRLVFESDTHRIAVGSRMLRTAASLTTNEVPPEPESRPDLFELFLYFGAIEQGIVASLQEEQTAETHQAIITAAQAYHVVFLSIYPMLQRLAHEKSRPSGGYQRDDLLQVASEAVLRKIFVHEQDWSDEDNAEYLYKSAYNAARHAINDYNDKMYYEQHVVGARPIKQVYAQYNYLCQRLQRTPTVKEVAASSGLEEGAAAYYLHRIETASTSLQVAGTEAMLSTRLGQIQRDFVDELCDKLYVQKIFNNDSLDDREKILLSLYSGIYIEALGGRLFLRKSRQKGTGFTYPDSKEVFDAIVRDTMYSPKGIGEVVQLHPKSAGTVLKKVLAMAQTILVAEIQAVE